MALFTDGPKRWRASDRTPWGSVEQAAFARFEAEGWTGDDGEGGLILSLIKAASIRNLSPVYASAFVEGLYFHPRSGDMPSVSQMLTNVACATTDDVLRTYRVLAAGANETPVYYPSVTRAKILGLFAALGRERLHAIATLFAAAPYELRAGWPDLTLWRDDQILFREVKAPGDRLHASQKRLVETILRPLSYDVGVIDVQAL